MNIARALSFYYLTLSSPRKVRIVLWKGEAAKREPAAGGRSHLFNVYVCFLSGANFEVDSLRRQAVHNKMLNDDDSDFVSLSLLEYISIIYLALRV